MLVVDPTLDPSQDQRPSHPPGFFEKRQFTEDLIKNRSFDNWNTRHEPKDDLVVASLTTRLGTYTLTDVRGARSLFLQRSEDTVQLDELLSNQGIGPVLGELCESVRTVSIAEIQLFDSIPRVAQHPVALASVPRGESWLVTFGAAGIYLDHSSGDGSVQIHCANPEKNPSNYHLKIQVAPSILTWRDHSVDLAWRDLTSKAKEFPVVNDGIAALLSRAAAQFSSEAE